MIKKIQNNYIVCSLLKLYLKYFFVHFKILYFEGGVPQYLINYEKIVHILLVLHCKTGNATQWS